MLRGDFAAAWRISDAVLDARRSAGPCPASCPRHLQYLWDARPLRGRRVLVHCYHGLGDTVQFVRLLAPLRRLAREVTLWAQPALLGLLHAVDGADRIEPLHDGAASIARDADVELMELMHVLRVTPATLPARVPYLGSGGTRTMRRRPPRRIGLAWRAGEWNRRRSIAEADLAPLGRLRGLRYASLQFDAPAPLPFAADDLACADLAELARRMAGLDLVVSVDTMTAHLAGALGLPVWTLLPYRCDWRWMRDRADSPWYPTMRLFRQPREGDWAAVIAEVAAALDPATAAPTR